MKKNTKTIFAVAIVIILMVAIFTTKEYLKKKMIVKDIPTMKICSTKEQLLSKDKYTINQKTDTYKVSVDVELPQDIEISQMLTQKINTIMQEFITSTNTLTQEDLAMSASIHEQVITGEFYVYKNIINYSLHVYNYTGGAHGITSYQTFIIPISSGVALNFPTIVTSPELFKTVISSTIIPTIITQLADVYGGNSEYYNKKTLEDQLLKSDTWLDNFNTFKVSEKGIIFVFGAYQIAPYSSGEPEILVPWNIISPVLTQEFLATTKLCK